MSTDKIIFFHMNQLGDLLFSLPTLMAARKQWPNAKIVSVAKNNLNELLKATGFVDEVLVKPSSGFLAKASLIKKIRKENFTKAICFSESFETAFYCALSKAKEKIGFNTASVSFLLNKKAQKLGVPSLSNNARLAQGAGLVNISADYTGLIKIPQSNKSSCTLWLSQNKLIEGNFVVLSPGASKRRAKKKWSDENWVELAKEILEQCCPVVFVGASWEKEKLQQLAALSGAYAFWAQEGVLSLAALINASFLFCGVDSGAMHLAAAMCKKVVALFGPTDPAQIGPMPLKKHTIIKADTLSKILPDRVLKEIKLARGHNAEVF